MSQGLTSIERSIDDLIAHPNPKLLPVHFHIGFYTEVYNYATSSRLWASKEPNIPGLAELGLGSIAALSGAHLYCTLSNKLESYLANISNAAVELHGESLLEYYSVQWKDFSVKKRMLDRAFAFITRHWVKSLSKRPDIYTIEALAATRWKAALVDGLQDHDQKLTNALMHLVSSHRAGKTVHLDLLKSVLASLATLGRSGEHGEITTLDVYEDVFENVFLHESTEYYRREAGGLALEGVQRYVPEIGSWADVEGGFANVLPTKESCAKLQAVLRDILIIAHSQLIEAYMMDSKTHDEGLKGLYFLCLRLGAQNHLRETFIRLYNGAARSLLSEEKAPNARSKLVFDIKRVFSNIVVENFEKDRVILEALDRDTTAIIQGPSPVGM